MTNKQSAKGYSIADETFSLDLLNRNWIEVQKQVQRVIEFNRQAGVKNPDAFIGYGFDPVTRPPMDVLKIQNFWNAITHKNSGKIIDIPSLTSSGRFSDIEFEMYQGQTIPRIEIQSLIRIQVPDSSKSGQEYLQRLVRVYGLDENGRLKTMGLDSLDYTRKVPIEADLVNQNGVDIKVLKVGTTESAWPTLKKLYLTPFSEANVRAYIEKYPPSPDNELQGRITYLLKREGTTAEVSVSSLEEFINADFNETFNRLSAPQPAININSKDLQTFVKLDHQAREEHKQYS